MLLQDVYQSAFRLFMSAVVKDVVPDYVLRRGIRHLLSQRVRQVEHLFQRLTCSYSLLSIPLVVLKH